MNVPGPRTRPTVPSISNKSITNNRRPMSGWELRLGLPQVVVVVGLVTGSMVLSFYLGLNSGQRLGFELAQERTATSLPRLPVPGASPEGSLAHDDGAFDVYAKLNDTLPGAKGEGDPIKVAPVPEAESPLGHGALFPSEGGAGGKGTGMPELGSIKSVDAAPLLNPEAEAALNARLAAEQAPPAAGTEPRLGELELAARGSLVTEDAPQEIARVESAPKVEKVVAPPSQPQPEPAAKTTEGTKSAEPARVVAPEAKSAFLKKSLPLGWFAQVGAMPSLAEAEGIAKKLKSSGFPVVIEAARVRGEDYFRILVGPERSRDQGDILVSQLRREPYISGEPFLRLIK